MLGYSGGRGGAGAEADARELVQETGGVVRCTGRIAERDQRSNNQCPLHAFHAHSSRNLQLISLLVFLYQVQPVRKRTISVTWD